MTWPDIVIVGIVLIAVLKGFKNGLVAELAGVVAIAFGLAAAWWYRGSIDGFVAATIHVGMGSAHVIAMAIVAIGVYGLAVLASMLLRPIMRFPGLNIANAVLGGALGVVKAAFFLWAILYVALFFPLSPDLRGDLHRSALVAMIAQPNDGVDAAVKSTLPWFVKPFLQPLFGHHRV